MTETPELAKDSTKPAHGWLPWAVTAGLIVVTAGVLHLMGRVWWCQANSGWPAVENLIQSE